MSRVIALFTTDSPELLFQFTDTFNQHNPKADCYALPAGHRTEEFNKAVKALGTGKSDDILLFCDDDIVWHGEVLSEGYPFFSAGIVQPLTHHVPDQGWLKLPYPVADGYAIGIERWLFEEVGGWDEEFKFSGFQEVDMTLKIREKGWEMRHWENFPGTHLWRGTKNIINPNHLKTRITNLHYLIKKWDLPVITAAEREKYELQGS